MQERRENEETTTQIGNPVRLNPLLLLLWLLCMRCLRKLRVKEKKVRIRKSTLKRIIAEATRSLNESHPYDKGLMQAMDIGYYSDADARDEIENDLMRVDTTGLSPAAMEELEELKYAIEGGYNDNAYRLLRSISKEIKDRLPVQEFSGDDDY